MKKFFLTLTLIFIFVSSVSAATSEDVYVRQDVFDAKMELLFTRLHSEIQSLGNEIKGEMKLLEQRLDAKITAVDQRLTTVETNLNEKITSLNDKITAVETNLNEKIEAVDKNLNEKITDVEKKLEYSINTWATVLGWGIGWLTLLITLVAAAPVIREWVKLERKPSVTLDDVRRLIEENNAKLNLNASR